MLLWIRMARRFTIREIYYTIARHADVFHIDGIPVQRRDHTAMS
jgi:hypothetical protein